jgi:hypothetical protein
MSASKTEIAFEKRLSCSEMTSFIQGFYMRVFMAVHCSYVRWEEHKCLPSRAVRSLS